MDEVMKQAATIILIRNYEQKLQVYMTKRPDSMKFLPGHHVFPGGVMQAEDKNQQLFSRCTNQDLVVDLSYSITAIRECFEEVGYLLADLPACEASSGDNRQQLRLKMNEKQMSFHEWAVEKKVRLRTDLIRYFGHRITPRTVSRIRFDTRYFLTIVPQHVKMEPDNREVAKAEWMEPEIALEYLKKGTMKMVPPTIDALTVLTQFPTAEAAYQSDEGVGTPRPHELA